MMAELMVASWETIARRSLMMLQGTCSPAEYQRMTTEKVAAIQQSALAVMFGRGKGRRWRRGTNAPLRMRSGCERNAEPPNGRALACRQGQSDRDRQQRVDLTAIEDHGLACELPAAGVASDPIDIKAGETRWR